MKLEVVNGRNFRSDLYHFHAQLDAFPIKLDHLLNKLDAAEIIVKASSKAKQASYNLKYEFFKMVR